MKFTVLTEVSKMIFSELYSVYYKTVAKIIEKAFEKDVTEKELRQCVENAAFSESTLTILPALKSGKWPLLGPDLSPVLKNKPSMPLTTLEKRWLKAIEGDPRVKLFGVSFPGLEDVEPLFTKEDYRVFDCYCDGDPFENENYINNFRVLLTAMKKKLPVRITMPDRNGRILKLKFIPIGFEYSEKDDKIRIVATGCKYKRFNLAKIISCRIYTGGGSWNKHPREEQLLSLSLLITDGRNALERAMLHFAHFEKRAERAGENKYVLHLKYYENDETELVIRVLSFGPYVKVLEPQHFANLIKERLISQKSCELR